MHWIRNLSFAIVAASIWAGCGRSDVQSYRVPKEEPKPASSQSMASADESNPHDHDHDHADLVLPKVKWGTVPDGWKPGETGKLRVASFEITQGDRRADLSIIPLPGVVGRDDEIVNLWRDQLQLSPLEGGILETLAEKVKVGGQSAKLYDMVSTNALVDDKFKARTMAVMLSRENTSWFFKMTGEDQLVREQKKPLLAFLKTIEFDAAPAVAAAAPSLPPPAVTPSASGGGKPAWTVPANWKEQAPSAMLLAKYYSTGNGATVSADITVSALGGTAGGGLANVNRWRGQLGLSPIGEEQLKTLATTVPGSGTDSILVDMTSETPKPGQKSKSRMVVAMIPRDGQTWFYKLLGDETIVEREKEAFLKFIQSAKH